MLADQKLLEVSAASTMKLKEESRVTTEVLSRQLQTTLTNTIFELLYGYLISGSKDKRSRCRALTHEPVPNSAEATEHMRSIVHGLVDDDVAKIAQRAAERLEHLSHLQVDYCEHVFAKALTDSHRFVVDAELKEIFDQLRLYRALKAQETAMIGFDPMMATGVSADGSEAGSVQPHSANAKSDVSSVDGMSPLGGGTETKRSAFLHSAANSRGDLLTSLSSSPSLKGSKPTVVSHREHIAELRKSFDRELLLHAKLEAMHRALQERAAKEKDSVDLLTKKFQEAQENATVEMQQQLLTFRSELATMKETNERLRQRLEQTVEIAYVLDELCGKLNAEVLTHKAMMIHEGFVSNAQCRLDNGLKRLHTTHCCRGKPLVVDGGWKFGEAPKTTEWMEELKVGAVAVPTAECLAAQHTLLEGVLKETEMERQNTELQKMNAKLTATLQEQHDKHLQTTSRLKSEWQKRIEAAEHRLSMNMKETQKLREEVAALRSTHSGISSPRIGISTTPRCGGGGGGTTPILSSASTRPSSAASNNFYGQPRDARDEVYMDLVRCKRELHDALTTIALHEVRTASSRNSRDDSTVDDGDNAEVKTEIQQQRAPMRPVERPTSARRPSAAPFAMKWRQRPLSEKKE